jgi:hypothetical protein
LSQASDAGYYATRPAFTRDRWLVELEFKMVRPSGFTYIVDFFHDHRGGTPFYFRFYFGLWGIPPEYAIADPGGVSPWSSEIEPGFGDAPTWLVRFDPSMSKLPFSRYRAAENYWEMTSPLVVVQI